MTWRAISGRPYLRFDGGGVERAAVLADGAAVAAKGDGERQVLLRCQQFLIAGPYLTTVHIWTASSQPLHSLFTASSLPFSTLMHSCHV